MNSGRLFLPAPTPVPEFYPCAAERAGAFITATAAVNFPNQVETIRWVSPGY